MSLSTLLGRIEHEWATRKKIFDLPNARIWKPDDEIDLSFEFLGLRCATPIDPAAEPHSQLATNIEAVPRPSEPHPDNLRAARHPERQRLTFAMPDAVVWEKFSETTPPLAVDD